MVNADSRSTVTYSGSLSLTSSITQTDDPYSYPGQSMSRTCVVNCPFSGLTLTSYDGGSTYSGSVTGQATYTSDWTITPPSITNSQSSTRSFSPSSDHFSTTEPLMIYAEIKSSVLSFIFSYTYVPSPTQVSVTYTLTDPTHTTPFSAKTSYTSPTMDAASALDHSTQEGTGVTVPKSSNPMQSQTIPFNGEYQSSYDNPSLTWTGTLTLNVGSLATDAPVTEAPATPGPTGSFFFWDWNSGYWSGTAWYTNPDGEEEWMAGEYSVEAGTKIRTSDNPVEIIMPHAGGTVDLAANSELHFIGIQKIETDIWSEDWPHYTVVPLPDWVHMSKYDEEGLVNQGLGPISLLLANAPGPNSPVIPIFYFLYQGAMYLNDETNDIPLPDWAYEEDQNPITVPVAIPDGVVVPQGTAYSIRVAGDGSSVIEVSDGSVLFIDPITGNNVTVNANERLTLPAPTAGGFTVQALKNAVSTNTSGYTLIAIVVVAVVVIVICILLVFRRYKRHSSLQPLPPPPPPPPP